MFKQLKTRLLYPVTTLDYPNHFISEQFRKLRSNINSISKNTPIKTLQFVSTTAYEDSDLSAVNLAITYSQSKHKTLLIDMNLHSPSLHKAFKIPNDVGLSNLENDTFSIDKLVQEVNPNLDVLTSGKTIDLPAELLMSNATENALQHLKERYDKIIISSPPLSDFSDALTISDYCDGTVFTIGSRIVNEERAKNALKELEDNGILVLGALLTRVKKKDKRFIPNYKS